MKYLIKNYVLEQQFKLIFSEIETILFYNNVLLNNLEILIKQWDSNSTKITEIFIIIVIVLFLFFILNFF